MDPLNMWTSGVGSATRSNSGGGAVNTVTGTPQGSGVPAQGARTPAKMETLGTTPPAASVPAPGSAQQPTGGYTPYQFSWQDIYHIAQSIDPQTAADLGFSNASQNPFQSLRGVSQQLGTVNPQYTAADFANTFFPGDPTAREALYHNKHMQVEYPQVLQFMDALNNTMAQLEQLHQQQFQATGQSANGAPGTPGGTTVGPPGPGGYGANELAAYLRPLSPQEQDYLNFVKAAQTGMTPRDPNFESGMQGYINQQMANGQMPNVASLVGKVAQQQQSNPGISLYDAAQGKLPQSLQDAIQERVLQGMGNIGARYATGTAAATGTALANAAQERMMQGQNLLAQMSSQAALIQAQREQQAQDALYQEYLRNSGLDPSVVQLMNILSLNRGTTGQGSTVLPGANSLSALGKGLAEGGQITSSMGGTVPQQADTGPNTLSANYPQAVSQDPYAGANYAAGIGFFGNQG